MPRRIVRWPPATLVVLITLMFTVALRGWGRPDASVRPSSYEPAALSRTVTIPNLSAAWGATVDVPVIIDAQGDENAFGFSVTYDPTVLTYGSTAVGTGAAGASLLVNTSQTSQGRVGVLLGLGGGQALAVGLRQLVVVTFTVRAGTGTTTTPVGFGDQPVVREVADVTANPVAVAFTGGVVTLGSVAFVTNVNALSVPEGGTATFLVKLSGQPGSNVTVNAARQSGDTDISVSGGASLTFTTSNWDTYQTVTLAAAEDVDAANGVATIRLTATGLADKDVTATETDNDTLAIVTNTNAVSVPEGSTATFQVKLSAQPGSNVTVGAARLSGDTDISVSGGASLTFTTSNWDTYQTVTLAAAEDVDAANGVATIRLTATGLADKDVTATEADYDSAPTFTDDPLVAATTRMKAVHITELRTAIDALRARYNLSAFAWTDATLSAGVTSVKAVHVTELRTALNAVYTAATRALPTYTDPTLTVGTTGIKAVHITELRAAVLAIW